jgi:hypothetical protein
MESELSIHELEERLVNSAQRLLSAAFFGVGLLTLDVPAWKVTAVCALIYFLHAFRFGSRRIEQVGVLMLAFGVLSWINVISIPSIVESAKVMAAIAAR